MRKSSRPSLFVVVLVLLLVGCGTERPSVDAHSTDLSRDAGTLPSYDSKGALSDAIAEMVSYPDSGDTGLVADSSVDTVVADDMAGPDLGSPAMGSEYEVELQLPACDTSNPEVKIIDSDDDWSSINSASYRVFCVMPRDYAAAGNLTITTSGTAAKPRYLRYYAPNDSGKRPWEQNVSERAIVQSLKLVGASYWVVHRLVVTDPDHDSGARYLLDIREDSDHNIVSDVLVEKSPLSLAYVGKGSDDNLIQRSVFRETAIGSTESHCLFVNAGTVGDAANLQDVKRLKVISSELYDCAGDCIQFWTSDKASPSGDLQGLIVSNNDFYITPQMYTDCTTGSPDPQGACACAENALDFKIGVRSSAPAADDVMQISNNRMWGFRDSFGAACPQVSSLAHALIFHNAEADYASIAENVIFDSAGGYYASDATDHLVFSSNVIHTVANAQTGGGRAAMEIGGSDGEIFDNVVVSTDTYLMTDGENFTIRNNTFVDAGDWKRRNGGDLSSSSMGYNHYVNTAAYDGAADAGNNTISTDSSNFGSDLCVTIKRLTNPTQRCLPKAKIN